MTTPEEDDFVEVHDDRIGDDNDGGDKECMFQLLDHARGKELSFPAFITAMRGRWWASAKDDWLATVDKHCNAELVNPYTGRRISLPPLATIPEIQIKEGRTVVFGGVQFEEHFTVVFERGDYSFCRIIVCETPSSGVDDTYLVIAMVNVYLLAIARAGDESWTSLNTPHGRCGVEFRDVVLHKGKVFAVTRSGDIYTWDMRAGAFPDSEPEPIRPPHINGQDDDLDLVYGCLWNLAESADGRRLLLVACPHNDKFEDAVYLYERDIDALAGADGAGWNIVTSLGDHSLFLGANFPFLARVVNHQDDRELLWPNCVYHTDSYLFEAGLCDPYYFNVYDLGDKTFKPYREFYANHTGSIQNPIWFRPTLKNFL
ncbi:hypothetical protein EJB05_30823, partial [Eragrostis curvula]